MGFPPRDQPIQGLLGLNGNRNALGFGQLNNVGELPVAVGEYDLHKTSGFGPKGLDHGMDAKNPFSSFTASIAWFRPDDLRG